MFLTYPGLKSTFMRSRNLPSMGRVRLPVFGSMKQIIPIDWCHMAWATGTGDKREGPSMNSVTPLRHLYTFKVRIIDLFRIGSYNFKLARVACGLQV